jgi:hypothetical protein
MADTKISELTAANAASDSVLPASNASGSATNKVTLQSVARLFSDNTGIAGADRVTNLVSLTQAEYDSLVSAGSVSSTTLYVIQG